MTRRTRTEEQQHREFVVWIVDRLFATTPGDPAMVHVKKTAAASASVFNVLVERWVEIMDQEHWHAAIWNLGTL
jgi:hypothetical protein